VSGVPDPLTAATVIGVINAAFKFATTGLEVYQTRFTAEVKEREREESLAAEARRSEEERQLAREEYVRARRATVEDARRDFENAKALARSKKELDNYPLRYGPGALRQSLGMLSDDPSQLPLIVLFVPAHKRGDKAWRSLPRRLQAALMATEDLKLEARITDRWLSWPDAALIQNDLYDVPTIVVAAEVITGQLGLQLGGCNLGGDDAVRHLRQILWLPLPAITYWTDSRLEAFERTSRNGFRRPASDSPLFERELQLEWATRVAMVGIVAAVDAYYLLRCRGYREHVDEAVAVLGPEFALDSAPMPLDALADPAYHLMHQAKRQLSIGARDAAKISVSEALQILAGRDDVSLREAVLAAMSTGRLESWHRAILEELAAATGKPAVLPATVLAALRQPPPAASNAQQPDPGGRSEDQPGPEFQKGDRPRAKRRQGRKVPEIRQTSASASRGLSRGRPVPETWAGPESQQEGR
jgi:hypothetical protein